jgi:hypothetical protein
MSAESERHQMRLVLDDAAAAVFDADLVLPHLPLLRNAYVAARSPVTGRVGMVFKEPFADVGFWDGAAVTLTMAIRLVAAVTYFRLVAGLPFVPIAKR